MKAGGPTRLVGAFGLEADKLRNFGAFDGRTGGKVDTVRKMSCGGPTFFGGEGALAPGRPASPLVIRKILLKFFM